MIGYYCDKDKKFVSTVIGQFIHPHLGKTTCLVCAKCGMMVYRKEQ